jgi:hypothetical protein
LKDQDYCRTEYEVSGEGDESRPLENETWMQDYIKLNLK